MYLAVVKHRVCNEPGVKEFNTKKEAEAYCQGVEDFGSKISWTKAWTKKQYKEWLKG